MAKGGKSKRRMKRGNSLSGNDYRELSPNATRYTGPIETPSMREQLDCHTFPLRLTNTIASSAGGIINTVFDSASQATSSNAWTELAALFEEYRVLAFRVHLMPINKYSTAATNFPIFSVIDRKSTTPIASLNEAASSASSREHVINANITREARMDDVNEAGWTLTSTTPSASNVMYVKLYGSGLAASTNYYQYLNTIVVQFRGLRNV